MSDIFVFRKSELRRITKNMQLDVFTGCWVWNAKLTKEGYARISIRNKKEYLHRLTYQHWNGKIPLGYQIDHLCRNTSCINPEHLEAVTHKTNILRSMSFSALNSKKSSCIHGHLLTGGNLHIYADGRRRCNVCHRNNEKIRRNKRLALKIV